MHDADFLDKEAEYRIASELLRYGIIVATPLVDKLGADLFAMLRVNDGARFIRIQSKGRSLEKSKSCHIEIPKDYVTESFVCFLYIRPPSQLDVALSIFFYDDISSWTLNQKGEYTFSFSAGSYQKKLQTYGFNGHKAKLLIKAIQEVDIEKQFNMFINVYIHQGDSGFEMSKKQVQTTKAGGIYDTIVKDPIAGTESSGANCPGNPDDFDYDPDMDVWRAK